MTLIQTGTTVLSGDTYDLARDPETGSYHLVQPNGADAYGRPKAEVVPAETIATNQHLVCELICRLGECNATLAAAQETIQANRERAAGGREVMG